MIKGVNRQMIEVKETGSPYFERALLVVRPDCTDLQDFQLHEEAQKLLETAGSYTGLRRARRHRKFRRLLFFLGTSGGGLLLGYWLHMVTGA